MKKNTILIIAVAFTFVISSCKKDEPTPPAPAPAPKPNPVAAALGGSPTIPSGAAGALYIINQEIIYDNDTTSEPMAFAWFDSYVNTKDAGTVTCNGTELVSSIDFLKFAWYTNFGDYIDLYASPNNIDWTVAGSSSVAGFTHTDNSPWPKFSYTLPAAIEVNKPFTVSGTVSGKHDAVFFSIWGLNEKRVTKQMPANATSATFTASELKSVAQPGSEIGVQVMPVTMTEVKLNGKSYYFVKQYANSQAAETL